MVVVKVSVVVVVALVAVGCASSQGFLEKWDSDYKSLFEKVEKYEAFQAQFESLQALDREHDAVSSSGLRGSTTGGHIPTSIRCDDTGVPASSSSDASSTREAPPLLHPK
jgi:hypothetical protein